MTSVRLKLYEILDMEDKLHLLQFCSRQSYTLLPTFASNFCITDTIPIFPYKAFSTSFEFNFDFNDSSAIHFEPNQLNSNSRDYQGPCLHLRPKRYHLHAPSNSLLQKLYDTRIYDRILMQLGLGSVDESFKLVTIPSFYVGDEYLDGTFNRTIIQLLGNMNKNVWILCSFDENDERLSPRLHINKNYTFRAY
ncbi:uncharacterized protein BX664DRAFT_320925 [Halteromyces radiatus]|uniref:uncharacterized protein n=1 Tax=Halteromyces radiatus TaxID=101107 RepID=UPI002220418B|nr:uncharacterized protein BX664DRAFT_320925 [Halteromyces radiatus]KAI8099286.1 hypothetical protein BX664DRAFT_320925 [Halteromyces radiatus]